MTACLTASTWQDGAVKLALLTILSVILIGCATPKTPVSLPPVTLEQTATRLTTGMNKGTWHFPRGEYLAAYRDSEGVYYKPPTPIILGDHPYPEIFLFVGDDGRHAVYKDGTAIVMVLTEKLPIK